MKKNITAISMLFLYIFSAMIFFGFTTNTEDIEQDSSLVEERRSFSNATIEDDFAEDRIIVVLNRQETMRFRNYTADDFAEISVRTVENVTETSRTMLIERLQRDASTGLTESLSTLEINAGKFRTILVLELYNRGKQNVLDAIRALDGRGKFCFLNILQK
jgi:hypothetical protein